MPEREIRAAVLFDLIDARRNAFAEGEGPGQLCECERRLVAYDAEIKPTSARRASASPTPARPASCSRRARPDRRPARRDPGPRLQHPPARQARRPEPAAEPVPEKKPPSPRPPPSPARPPTSPPPQVHDRRRRTLTAVGGVFLILMVSGLVVGRKAERDGDPTSRPPSTAGTPLSRTTPPCRTPCSRGKTGNGLAIAGGVIGGTALAAGVPLLVLGKRPQVPTRPP
jgi:hypothetical protein